MSRNPSNSAILVVADRTTAAGPLASAIRERARVGPCRFTLLVPAVAHGLHRVVDPEDQCCAEAERTIGALRPALEAAAGGPMTVAIGSHDPMAAIQDALNAHPFEEVILATRSHRFARWTHVDLTSKVRGLGVALTTVEVRARIAA
jgi:hypothetical protein